YHRKALPFRTERDAPLLQRRVGDRFGVRAIDPDRRRIGVKRTRQEEREKPAQREQWQRALRSRRPRPGSRARSVRHTRRARDTRLPRAVRERRRQFEPTPRAYAAPEY